MLRFDPLATVTIGIVAPSGFLISSIVEGLAFISDTDTAVYPTGSYIAGGVMNPVYKGSGSIPDVRGISIVAQRTGNGTVTNIDGVRSFITNQNAIGTVTRVSNFFSASPINIPGATITDIYGIFIEDQTPGSGTVTNTPFGVYQVGTGDFNYFGGNVGIGRIDPTMKLDVVGNASFTGNVTSSNLFVPQYVFPHTDQTIPLVAADTWENITFSQETTDIKFGISHTFNDNTNHTFTINQDGIYDIEYDFDVIDTSVGASDIDAAGRVIFINETEILGSAFETDITKQQIETELSHSFLARLHSGDEIVFQFIADDVDVAISTHGTFGDHPDSATIIIQKIANI